MPNSYHCKNWKCQTRCIQMHSMSLARTSTFHIFPMASSETSKKSQHVNIFAYLVRLLCFPYLCLSMLSILHIRVFCMSLLGILSFCIRQIDCLLLLFSFVCLSFIVIIFPHVRKCFCAARCFLWSDRGSAILSPGTASVMVLLCWPWCSL